jgi:hypothetical protein
MRKDETRVGLNFRAALGLSQLLLNQDRSSEVLRPALSSVAVNSSCVEVMVATELVSLLENRSSDAGAVSVAGRGLLACELISRGFRLQSEDQRGH